MIEYRESPAALDDLRADDLRGGFFEGWPNAPSPELHLAHLHGARVVILAIDGGTEEVVGFVTAVGDGVLAAFVPLLEVLPAYRGQGIGAELMRRVLARLSAYYSVDLVCDPGLVPYYERLEAVRLDGMGWRNHAVLEA